MTYFNIKSCSKDLLHHKSGQHRTIVSTYICRCSRSLQKNSGHYSSFPLTSRNKSKKFPGRILQISQFIFQVLLSFLSRSLYAKKDLRFTGRREEEGFLPFPEGQIQVSLLLGLFLTSSYRQPPSKYCHLYRYMCSLQDGIEELTA